ncbi:MAG: DUF2218 domain-containing protein [Mesorhizobium sp.]|nr:DUF2218 domain-containing protein [Mesorhizobium sp.]MCO5163207.1 DUF2218 domain-containing protein [Mesorhizobium sp.]
MAKSSALVPTEHASKYLQQLCKHWSHRLEVTFDPMHGTVKFPEAVATMSARDGGLEVTVASDAAETVERLKGVVSSHLDRFAFREAPLTFDWVDG